MKILEPIHDSEPVKEPGAQQAEQPTPEPDKPADDLMARVAKFTEENKPKVEVPEDFKFDINEIDKIEDPQARELAEKAYKSFQKGFTQKFQELAELRKSMEGSINKDKWTPERVQALTQDPEFLQAAQQVTNQGSEDNSDYDDSVLSDREKAEIKALKDEINRLKSDQTVQKKTVEDEQLSSKYSGYNPQAVDTLTSELISGKTQATRESLWKVLDYDDAIKRAYNLGKQDERKGISDNVQVSSIEGSQVVTTQDVPKKDENQSNKQHWRNIMANVLANSKSNASVKA